MTLVLRHASSGDLRSILRLNAHVQELHARLEPGFFKTVTDADELEAYFDRVLDNLDNKVILAEEEDLALGYIWLQIQLVPETPFTWPRKRMYIYQIAVDEAYRRRGVGSALFANAETLAADADVDCIALDAWTRNAVAQDFFRRRGFLPSTTGFEKPNIKLPDKP